jgi:hypothetical protein
VNTQREQPTAIIGWESLITGYKGYGSPIPRSVAEIEIIHLSKSRELFHWICPENGPNDKES